MADRIAYRQPQAGPQGFARTMKYYGDSVPLLTTDLALNKTVSLFMVPRGFVVTGIFCSVPDMDSNGTPTIQFSIGDAVDPARFLTINNSAQAGATNTAVAGAGLFYEFPEDAEIVWKTTTAAATAVAGTVRVFLIGFIR